MTAEEMKVIADKIRAIDPETRRKGLLILKSTLQLSVRVIDKLLEGGHNGTDEKQTHDKEPFVEGSAGTEAGTPE